MIIVLEGCDGAGKTTLAHNLVELAQQQGIASEIWHRGVPKRHPLEEYEWDLEQGYPIDPMERAQKLIVCDRWHMGQIVYGSIYRPGDDKGLGHGGVWHVNALLEAYGAVQIILSPPVSLMQERVRRDGDDYVKADDLPRIDAAYQVMAEQYIDSITLLEEPVNEHRASGLLELARVRTTQTAPLARFTTYVGPTQPDILLLGHQRNMNKSTGPSATRKVHRACFVPYGGTSGRFLCDTIVNSPTLAGQSIGIANAAEEDVSQLIAALHHPAVVTMGTHAWNLVVEQGITAGGVQHPQYVRRFRKDRQEEYAKAIYEAAYEETDRTVSV